MPRTEARVFTSIWQDPDFRDLEDGPQKLYLFLISQADMSHAGVIPLRLERWAAMTRGMTVATLKRNLKALCASKFILMDEPKGELLVRSLIRRDKLLRSPKMIKPLAAALGAVESPQLRSVLGLELERALAEGDVNPSLTDQTQTLIKLMSSQVNTLSDTVCDTPSDTVPDTHRGRGRGYVLELGDTTDNSRARASAPAKGTRIPEDFTVTPAMVSWARDNCPHVDGKRETSRFMDYWRAATGQKASKRDWEAAWRYWMSNAADRSGPRQGTLTLPGRLTPKDKIISTLGAGRLAEEARLRREMQSGQNGNAG